MEPISMNMSKFLRWHMLRSIFLAGVGSVFLISCSNLGYSSDANSDAQDSASSDPEALAAEFDFPLDSCGEQATEPSGTWYVVYVDGANPDEVRREYCQDAIGTVRDDTGAPTVQVASLTDYGQALKLATAVGGEVKTTVVDRATASPTTTTTAQSPGQTGQPGQITTAQASSGSNSATSSEMATLTATDPGSLINIRESASTSAAVQHTGRAGEQVQIAEQQQGDDGRTWYKVSLESGSEGWVRSDFVSRQSASNAATSNSSFGTSSNVGTNTATTPSSNAPTTDSTSRSTGNNGGYSSSGTGQSAVQSTAASGAYNSADPSPSDRASGAATQVSDPGSAASEAGAYEADTSAEDESEASAASGDHVTLRSENPGARINIRNDASTTADIQYTGYAGDSVQVIDAIEGEDGYTWYQVELDTGAVGWVRGDLVNSEDG